MLATVWVMLDPSEYPASMYRYAGLHDVRVLLVFPFVGDEVFCNPSGKQSLNAAWTAVRTGSVRFVWSFKKLPMVFLKSVGDPVNPKNDDDPLATFVRDCWLGAIAVNGTRVLFPWIDTSMSLSDTPLKSHDPSLSAGAT